MASQTWEQIWKAAMAVGPCRAAIEAAIVTQNVTATTLARRRNPTSIVSRTHAQIRSRTRHLHNDIQYEEIYSPHPRNRRNLRHFRLGGTTVTFLTSLLSIISVIRYLHANAAFVFQLLSGSS